MYKALIVEDEPLMREYLMLNLNSIHGMWETAGCARNGAEAVALLAEKRFDLVLTDIKMPMMSGLELADYIHRKYPGTDVVILTGYEEFDYARSAVRAGVVDYLLKPLQDAELCAVLDKLAEKRGRILRGAVPSPAAAEADDAAGALIRMVREHIQQHFREPLALSQIADKFGVNAAYLSGIFKSDKGESFTKYILRLRMERAALLLAYSAEKVGDIALELGYSTVKHFYSVFKKYYGVTPNSYRHKARAKP